MNLHSILDWLLSHIVIRPPQEANSIVIPWVNSNLMEHGLNIRDKGDRFLTKSVEDTKQVVGQIRTMQKLIVQRSSSKFCRTIENHSQLIWFVGMENCMMRKIPQRFTNSFEFLIRYPTCIPLGNVIVDCPLVPLKEIFIAQKTVSSITATSVRPRFGCLEDKVADFSKEELLGNGQRRF